MRTMFVDLDATVCHMLEAWLNKIQREFGVCASIEDIDKWELHSCSVFKGILDKEQVISFLNDKGFYRDLAPMEYAAKTVLDLSSKFDVHIATSRIGDYANEETSDWVEEHMPHLSQDIIFIRQKELLMGDVLIDDCPHQVMRWLESNPNSCAVVVGYPYNTILRFHPRVYWFDYSSNPWTKIRDFFGLPHMCPSQGRL